MVLVLAVAAGQMGSLLHTQLRKVAACPWRQCGGHSGPGSSAPADGGCGCCLSPGHHSAWGRSRSRSKVAVHLWGRTAEWPLVPRTPHSCERRGFHSGVMDPETLGQVEESVLCAEALPSLWKMAGFTHAGDYTCPPREDGLTPLRHGSWVYFTSHPV